MKTLNAIESLDGFEKRHSDESYINRENLSAYMLGVLALLTIILTVVSQLRCIMHMSLTISYLYGTSSFYVADSFASFKKNYEDAIIKVVISDIYDGQAVHQYTNPDIWMRDKYLN